MSNHCASPRCASSSPGGSTSDARNAAPAMVNVFRFHSITRANTFDAGTQIAIIVAITAAAASGGVPSDASNTIIKATPNAFAVALKKQ